MLRSVLRSCRGRGRNKDVVNTSQVQRSVHLLHHSPPISCNYYSSFLLPTQSSVQSLSLRPYVSSTSPLLFHQRTHTQTHTKTKTNTNTNTNRRADPTVNETVFSAATAIFVLVLTALLAMDNTSSCKNDKNIDLEMFLKELPLHINTEKISYDEDDCNNHGKPWSSYHVAEKIPNVVVYPSNTEDVSVVVKLCNKFGIPLIPFGGGTSLEGQILAPKGGVSLDFQNMQQIVEVNERDLDVTVQAGLGYLQLNEQLKDKNIWYPLDPGPGATIGGMCACRCSGSTAVRYGSMRDNVLSLKAVLPDGSILKTGGRARKSSAGYDLTRLLIGSEGTLAVITEATLKVYPIPKVSHAIRITFPKGVKNASITAADTLNKGVTIGRCELLDDVMVQNINQATGNPHPWPEQTTLLYEVTGISEDSVNEQVELITNVAKKHGGTNFYVARDKNETEEFWRFRKECLWSAMACNNNRQPMITDVCVPLSKLPSLMEESMVKILESKLNCPIVAHAGDGNFHVFIFFDEKNDVEVNTAKELATWMGNKSIEMGGTCTGEHGIGVGKKELLKKEVGSTGISLMQNIKATIDPNSTMNPGKVIDLPAK